MSEEVFLFSITEIDQIKSVLVSLLHVSLRAETLRCCVTTVIISNGGKKPNRTETEYRMWFYAIKSLNSYVIDLLFEDILTFVTMLILFLF